MNWAMRRACWAAGRLGGWALGQHWPLVAIFALFCGPLLIAALSTAGVGKDV